MEIKRIKLQNTEGLNVCRNLDSLNFRSAGAGFLIHQMMTFYKFIQ